MFPVKNSPNEGPPGLHKLKGWQVPQAEAEAAVVLPNTERDQTSAENILVVRSLLS